MSKSTSSAAASGTSFTSLLTLLFIGLKLGNVIDWSWWWVLSPLWIHASVVLVAIVIVFIVMVLRD